MYYFYEHSRQPCEGMPLKDGWTGAASDAPCSRFLLFPFLALFYRSPEMKEGEKG